MDMRSYAATYVKPDDVRDDPISTRIITRNQNEKLIVRCLSLRPDLSSRSTKAIRIH